MAKATEGARVSKPRIATSTWEVGGVKGDGGSCSSGSRRSSCLSCALAQRNVVGTALSFRILLHSLSERSGVKCSEQILPYLGIKFSLLTAASHSFQRLGQVFETCGRKWAYPYTAVSFQIIYICRLVLWVLAAVG